VAAVALIGTSTFTYPFEPIGLSPVPTFRMIPLLISVQNRR